MKCPKHFAATFCLILIIAACGFHGALTPNKGTSSTGITGPLAITALVPSSAPVNSVPFTLVVNGDNFSPVAQVFWNNMPQFTVFVSANQLQVSVTEADLTYAGSAQVYVRDSGTNSNTVEFAVTF